MNVFNQLKSENNLDAAQIDDLVNKAFDQLANKYPEFSLQYDEDGITISNFDNCTEEERGGRDKDQVESNLTNELLKIANSLV